MTTSTSIETRTPTTGPKKVAETATLPRIQLRKRSSASAAGKPLGLHAVNSAFLSGLFADVALFAKQDDSTNDNRGCSKRTNRDDTRLDAVVPTKKSRLSIARSISRCAMSVRNLEDLASPTASSTDYFDSHGAAGPFFREDSLHYQLSCVGSDASALAFPHLPATVSQSSCGSLTRNVSDLQSSVAETEGADAYGWFVEMDAAGPRAHKDPYGPKGALAFSAATAPCADNHDDEVEWAKAADTVDDVLGDFF